MFFFRDFLDVDVGALCYVPDTDGNGFAGPDVLDAGDVLHVLDVGDVRAAGGPVPGDRNFLSRHVLYVYVCDVGDVLYANADVGYDVLAGNIVHDSKKIVPYRSETFWLPQIEIE